MPLVELVKDKLWEFENFLTHEEVSKFMSIISAAKEADWFSEDLPNYDQHHAGKTLPIDNLLEPIVEVVDRRVAALFTNTTRMVHIGSIVRGSDKFSPTGFHRDNEDQNMENNRNSENKYGVLMYLNDDFDGGEICYPEYDIEYKPKPGVLLIHYAGSLHGVNPISNGIRYSMTSFAWGLGAAVSGSSTTK